MPDYHSTFREGEKVRIRDRDYLRRFQKEWKFHHNVTDSQIEYGGNLDIVKQCGYYHGGDVLIELKNAPGVWHEMLLEEALPEGEKFVPASDHYDVSLEGKDPDSWIVVRGKNGKEHRVEAEWFGGSLEVKAMKDVARLRTKEGFESRYGLGMDKMRLPLEP
ncbi:MAG: hypothetical protein LN416_03955 [Candidatus Thermoplasmatota archaeon]|nr:hypothetical protein [Candidatus Thermoplasmatota archaeon]